MDRLKYLLVVLLLGLLFITPKVELVNKIEINTNKDEVLINFILEDNINAIYIQDMGFNTLFLLDYTGEDKKIEKTLKNNNIYKIDELYTITPVLINLFDINSEFYQMENNLILLNYFNNNFCIYIEDYQNEPDLNRCKFLYVLKFKSGILKDLIGNPEVIFQNENNPLPIKTQELIYDSWTELYTINNLEYTILKISKTAFDTLIISKEQADY